MRLFVGCLTLLLAGSMAASAQSLSSKPIRIIIPVAAGAATDILGRIAGDWLQKKTGLPVVIENRTGAGGNIALEQVAKGEPDGHTLLVATNGAITINPALFKKASVDTLNDVVPVAMLGQISQILAINSNVPAQTAQEFIALAKAKPGTINYGSAGLGTTPHLAIALFAKLAGIDIVHVPYRGIAPAMTDLVAGNIQAIAIGNATVAPFVESGRLRVLATASHARLPYLPEVPTAAEIGLPGWEVETWYALFAPRGTPKAIVDELNGHIMTMFDDPANKKAVRRRFLRYHADCRRTSSRRACDPTWRDGSGSSKRLASKRNNPRAKILTNTAGSRSRMQQRYDGLRSFLAECEKYGEVKVIRDADWNLEIGALTETVSEMIDEPPALMFDEIKGYPKGFRVLSIPTASRRRMAIALGLPTDTPKMEIVRHAATRIKHAAPIPPKEVETGPVMQNVMRDNEVDLFKFPVLHSHRGDGGRYIGTGDTFINRDPETGYVNMGTYRMQVHEKNLLGIWQSPGQQGRLIAERYWKQGKACPVVATFGGDPLLFFLSYTKFPFGVSELDRAGGILGRPVEVIKGPLNRACRSPRMLRWSSKGKCRRPTSSCIWKGRSVNGRAITPSAPRARQRSSRSFASKRSIIGTIRSC